MRNQHARTCAQIVVVLAVTLMLAGVAAASVNGAIQTTTSDGKVVNANIYPSKAAVYLTGGPQNEHDPGLSPTGTCDPVPGCSNTDTTVPYYFQVTHPSGALLLS